MSACILDTFYTIKLQDLNFIHHIMFSFCTKINNDLLRSVSLWLLWIQNADLAHDHKHSGSAHENCIAKLSGHSGANEQDHYKLLHLQFPKTSFKTSGIRTANKSKQRMW